MIDGTTLHPNVRAGRAAACALADYLDAGRGGSGARRRLRLDQGAAAPRRWTARRSATGSRFAATRSGGSPRSTCTSEQVILDIHRAIAALDDADRARAAGRDRRCERRPPVVRHRRATGRRARGVARPARRPSPRRGSGAAGVRWICARGADVAGVRVAPTAAAAPGRQRPRRCRRVHPSRVLAGRRRGRHRRVVHRSGPRRSSTRLAPAAIRYVGIGPATNFRARRRWTPLRGAGRTSRRPGRAVRAAWSALARSRARVARAVSRTSRALRRAPALRDAAVIGGIDCWPLVREQLAGVALLQWPWSARAMDEAAAALDALAAVGRAHLRRSRRMGPRARPRSRRRGIPSVGLQHGFIYRHWLNYLHEPDEMAAAGDDAGVPAPDADAAVR